MTPDWPLEAPLSPRSPCAHLRTQTVYGGMLSWCTRCGLLATSARPDFAYGAGYFSGEGSGGYDFQSDFALNRDVARFAPELRALEAQGLRGSMLDIGCATGMFLAHARKQGWKVAGVEPSDFARQRAEQLLGVPVAQSLDELAPGSCFDVVTLHHVLEHIHDPVTFLRNDVRRRVRQRLLVEVPNFASLASRMHGPRWRDLRPDQHVYHYTAATLASVVEMAGFRVVRVYTLWEKLWSLRAALELLALLPGLLYRPSHDGAAWGATPAAVGNSAAYRTPTGVKRLVVGLSRLLLWPVVRALETANLGPRLVLEAEPAGEAIPAEPVSRRSLTAYPPAETLA